MRKFDIRINGYQRNILLAALRHVDIQAFSREQYANNPMGSDTPVDELCLVQDMLEHIPNNDLLNDFTA